jgi:hypothetical protein
MYNEVGFSQHHGEYDHRQNNSQGEPSEQFEIFQVQPDFRGTPPPSNKVGRTSTRALTSTAIIDVDRSTTEAH